MSASKSGLCPYFYSVLTSFANVHNLWVMLVEKTPPNPLSFIYAKEIKPYECLSRYAYAAGGKRLQNVRFEGRKMMADPVSWADSSIRAEGAYIYNKGAQDALIAYFDFGVPYASTNGTFTIEWSDSGIITLDGGNHSYSAQPPSHPRRDPYFDDELTDAIEVYRGLVT